MTEPKSKCQNCGKVFKDEDLSEISDFWGRVSPGERMPSGECPVCGSLCQPLPTEFTRVGVHLKTGKAYVDRIKASTWKQAWRKPKPNGVSILELIADTPETSPIPEN